jgi:hypothetical protein
MTDFDIDELMGTVNKITAPAKDVQTIANGFDWFANKIDQAGQDPCEGCEQDDSCDECHDKQMKQDWQDAGTAMNHLQGMYDAYKGLSGAGEGFMEGLGEAAEALPEVLAVLT